MVAESLLTLSAFSLAHFFVRNLSINEMRKQIRMISNIKFTNTTII